VTRAPQRHAAVHIARKNCQDYSPRRHGFPGFLRVIGCGTSQTSAVRVLFFVRFEEGGKSVWSATRA